MQIKVFDFSANENIPSSTPKPARKWKKSRAAKQSLTLSSSRPDKGASQGASALGRKIGDYPTTGEGDVRFDF